MDELITFLLARFEEERAAARAAMDEATDYRIQGSRLTEDHFALWKPYKVLEEVETKSHIVDYCRRHLLASSRYAYGRDILRILGLLYAWHEDYKREWEPR